MNGAMERKTSISKPNINDIQDASFPDLKSWYESLWNHPVPRHASAEFLRGNVAWAVQVLEAGKNPQETRQELVIIPAASPSKTTPSLKPGSRLVREWQGTTHEVIVLKDGFQWNNRQYGSLSSIAKEITGSHWSGPRFFGLRARR